ncbi:hypothetical protein JK358_38360 [Nocardia sp. 2]|uniref:N-acetyltransferase domain-containing protein n=1 Tax=Nocardia acididurans TaxID=2802282 RepID=A0ABS1MI82_9NOCA|nr:hypothetical protein [Nocardia acididurans]MBL1080276.1 hypothetical protein [Nocardia acididurans]
MKESKAVISTWGDFLHSKGDLEAIEIHRLDGMCWMPFLTAPPGALKTRMEVFPEGQLCIATEEGELCAIVTTNRIDWNGETGSLGTWHDVAGNEQTCRETYRSDGNTLCLLSLSVAPASRGRNLAKTLLRGVSLLAERLNLEFVIVPARPNMYSKSVIDAHRSGAPIPEFDQYALSRRADGSPLDPWLRTLTTCLGMEITQIVDNAMVVEIEEYQFMSSKQSDWALLHSPDGPAWWVNETGFIYQERDGRLVYREKNVWCVLRRSPVNRTNDLPYRSSTTEGRRL